MRFFNFKMGVSSEIFVKIKQSAVYIALDTVFGR